MVGFWRIPARKSKVESQYVLLPRPQVLIESIHRNYSIIHILFSLRSSQRVDPDGRKSNFWSLEWGIKSWNGWRHSPASTAVLCPILRPGRKFSLSVLFNLRVGLNPPVSPYENRFGFGVGFLTDLNVYSPSSYLTKAQQHSEHRGHSESCYISCLCSWAVWPGSVEPSNKLSSFWGQMLPVMCLPHHYYHQKGNFSITPAQAFGQITRSLKSPSKKNPEFFSIFHRFPPVLCVFWAREWTSTCHSMPFYKEKQFQTPNVQKWCWSISAQCSKKRLIYDIAVWGYKLKVAP